MTNTDSSTAFDERIAKIRAINDRNLDARLNEKPWHDYARAAFGVAFTLALIFLFKAYL